MLSWQTSLLSGLLVIGLIPLNLFSMFSLRSLSLISQVILWHVFLLSSSVGRDGLTHNMLNDIHNHWKFAEAVRIKCLGVPTVDMKNVCTQLEVFGLLQAVLREKISFSI